MDANSTQVIEGLKKAANALERQDQPAAINSLLDITNQVLTLKRAAEKSEKEAAQMQADTMLQVSDLVTKQGKAYEDRDRARKELEATYAEIVAKKVSIQELNLRIDRSNWEKDGYQNELNGYQARLNELNDTSAGSIIISILTLGLDRAIRAISIEIDGVRGKIDNVNRTIGAYNNELAGLKGQLESDNARVTQLNATVDQKNKLIKDLNFLEFKLHYQEEVQRKKAVFYTQINLFYIKLQNMLTDISRRVVDVLDIVNELDSKTPTITSFDPTQRDLISLKQAIGLFGDSLERKISIDTSVPVFDENKWYYLTTEWLGPQKSLTADNPGAPDEVRMADYKGSPGQLWKITVSGNGYFKLSSKLKVPKEMLDIPIDRPLMNHSGNRPGMLWKIDPEFGYFRITSFALGDYRSLDIVNDGANNKLTMADSGNFSGQQWKITPAA